MDSIFYKTNKGHTKFYYINQFKIIDFYIIFYNN